MDDVPEQSRIFVGFFVVQIYQSSIKSNNIIWDYYSGVNSAPRRGSTRRHRPEQTVLTRRLRLAAAGCGAKSYTPKTAAEPATTRCWPSV